MYARDYYSKIDNSIVEILKNESDFYDVNIKEYGEEFTICPFELSLDLSNHCDVIICDYNYVFDLRVQLKRYFENGKQDFSLLIDEAHNLPDRLKSSYSAEIIREDIPSIIELISPISKLATEKLKKINDKLLEYNSLYKELNNKFESIPEDLIKMLRSFTTVTEGELIPNEFKGKKLLLDFYFNTLFFIKLSELFSKGHVFLITNSGGLGVSVEIYCIDPSYIFTNLLLKSKSHIFFSATLNPIEYYQQMLLKEREFETINIQSPFKAENLKIIIRDDIKTTYKERSRFYQEIANSIESAIECKKGNYIVFFPSYLFMNNVLQLMNYNVHIQKSNMNENERKDYINKFNIHKNILSFAIMGGIFGEGIDLVGDKLIGVIVVGVGLPQISYKGDLLKSYFNYNYAYTFPGFAKVMQAVGRVIRSEGDKGIAIFIDQRFTKPLYTQLYPYEWQHYVISNSNKQMKNILKDFWTDESNSQL